MARRHPEAEGKPVVIGNCQAGWQTMIMAATYPDVPDRSCWPVRRFPTGRACAARTRCATSGGMLGGTWLTRLAGDLGSGTFDGANLVANFESLNPANTYWEKPYNVYSKVDTEAERFLDFETWWGSPVLLNAEEMQWIADNLFVGNKLTAGEIRTSDGVAIDLRNIKSPIIVFCSWGDNITPPQQALGWITDLYETDDEIVATARPSSIRCTSRSATSAFSSRARLQRKEHAEFASCMDMIDLMPPGLYEAVIDRGRRGHRQPALIDGKYLFRLEPRTLDDIRALGGNSPEDDQKFAAVDRVSDHQPAALRAPISARWCRSVTRPGHERLVARKMHPNRVRFAIFSDENPAMQLVKALAEQARKDRQPVAEDNPFAADGKRCRLDQHVAVGVRRRATP